LTTLNIYQRLAAVAANPEVAYIKKSVGTGQGDAKGVARDYVVAKVRPHLLAAGIYVSTSQVNPGTTEIAGKSSKGTDLVRFTAMYATSFINVDNPEQRHVVQHEAHGNDYGDKAPGKASTYAEKLNIIKALCLETGIADEGRFPNEGDAGAGGAVADAKPTIGEEKLKNFCDSIAASDSAKSLTATWKLATDFIKANGDNDNDLKVVTDAASKRKGALQTAAKAAKSAPKTNAAGNEDAE
jgi:hypothetical protein